MDVNVQLMCLLVPPRPGTGSVAHTCPVGQPATFAQMIRYAGYAVQHVFKLQAVLPEWTVSPRAKIRAQRVLLARFHLQALCFCHTVLCQALALQGRQDRTAGRSSRAPRARTRKRQARPIAASVHTMQQTPLVLWAVRHVRIAYVTLSRVIHTYLTSTGGDNTVCNNCVPNGGTSGTGSFKLSNCQCMLHGTRACIDNHCRVMPAVYHHSSARSAGGRASASTSAEGADARSAGGQAFANTSAEGADARSAARRRTRQCQRIWRSSRRVMAVFEGRRRREGEAGGAG
jgi:hypothetical protein